MLLMLMKLLQNAIVSWKTTLLGVGAAIGAILNDPAILTDRVRLIQWACVFLMGVIAKDGDKTSEQTGAMLNLDAIKKGAGLFAMGCMLLGLSGCGSTDARVAAANNAASSYENTCVNQHMQIHAVEQKTLYNAQAADLQYKTDVSVNGAVATATANPKITPAQLAADISRTYQEQQLLLKQVNDNIGALQAQINQANSYHVAAQAIFKAIDSYNQVPQATATGVATAAVSAFQSAGVGGSAAVVVPSPVVTSNSNSNPTSTALPVPGQ